VSFEETPIPGVLTNQQKSNQLGAPIFVARDTTVPSDEFANSVRPGPQYAQAAIGLHASGFARATTRSGSSAGATLTQIPTADATSPNFLVEPAQFLPFFARPPIWIPRYLRPLDELPPGSANGERAGMPFPRNMGKPKTPDEYPRCTYCDEQTGSNNFHRDHVIPRSRGGDGSEHNYAPACKNCNLGKHTKTPEEWYRWLQNGGV
jgi:hypothetical protein